ncbi:hypothetical protein O6H91_Y368100 [Diphasiastrum complanatum]|nr:hypothetical protein O6H91_Y368100 [Diphasiastrum complanatum]
MKIYVSALRRPPSLLHPPHNGMDRISAKRLSSSSSVYAKFKCFSFSNPFIMPSLELQNGTILFLHKPTNTAATPQALRIRLCTILHLIGVNSLGLRVNPSSVRAVKQSDSSNSIADDEEFEFREAEEVGSAEDGDKFDDFEKVSEGNVDVMVEKIGSNKRRVTAHVCIEAPLDTVWQVLTDYEGLADFIPNLVACQLLERREHGARLLQIGEQKVALGLKFQAKGVLDVQENPVQISLNRICRDIMFEMVEGDFQVFRGVWHLEQVKSPLGGSCENLNVESNVQTILSYILDVQPKIWLQ